MPSENELSHQKAIDKVSPIKGWYGRLDGKVEFYCRLEGSPQSKALFQTVCAASVPEYVPEQQLVFSDSPGTPQKLETSTPRQRTLVRVYRLGPMTFFAAKREKPLTSPILAKAIQQGVRPTPTPSAILPALEHHKSIYIKITIELINAVRAKWEEQKCRRKISQDSVMNAPALKLKEAYFNPERLDELLANSDLSPEQKEEIKETVSKQFQLEWLHLVAYTFGGEDGQIPENLVAGTTECNTQMMMAEQMVRIWLREQPDKEIHLYVTAQLVPGTHIATKIIYTLIREGGYTYTFEFNPMSTFRPAVGMAMAAKAFAVLESRRIRPQCSRVLFPDAKVSCMQSTGDENIVDESIRLNL